MNDKNDKDSPSVVSFSLRIDTELKRQFEQFCDDVGISIRGNFNDSCFHTLCKKGCQGIPHSL